MTTERFDYVVIGSGVGGLFTAALLAQRGLRVGLLERHYAPGGYGHSFRRGAYTFCAQLHYLWNCGAKDDFGLFLRRLGLENAITFQRLDRDGFDRVRCPSFSYDIVSGFDRNVERLAARYPQHRPALVRYFDILTHINQELLLLPIGSSLWPLLATPWRFGHVLWYRNHTLGDLFRELGLPAELRAILAGQSFDLLLPPAKLSLLAQAAVACGYDAGACVPSRSYEHLFTTLTDYIARQPGCAVHLKTWVKSLEVRSGRVTAAHGVRGRTFEADRFIYNGDPKKLPELLGTPLPRSYQRKLAYDYSASFFTLYLGIRGLDLARHGFGNWNVMHYGHDDVDECYRRQVDDDRFDNPSMFLSTPTLHQRDIRIAPDGCEQMVVCVPCRFEHFQAFHRQGRPAYLAEKERVTNLVLDQIERHYLPDLRQHLDLVEAGTPCTHERFVFAPRGNAYGADLTPRQFNTGKIDYRTPYPNLWLVGATAGGPSFAGGIHFARLLYEKLTGDQIRNEKDRLP